jgi:AAA ATPase domain
MTVSSGLPPLADGVTLCELGVDNLRALRMETPVELRRLTLLAGRNGIGKSTFARVFPLLRQSAGRRKREPILWWERDEIDFGGFDEALRRSAERIRFTFGFADANGTRWRATSELGPGSEVSRVDLEDEGRRVSFLFDHDGKLEKAQGMVSGRTFEADDRDLGGVLRAKPDELFMVPNDEEETALRRFLAQRRGVASSRPDVDVTLVWALDGMQRAADLIHEISTRTAYLGPFRAAPERTYRPQSVAVEQLDPRGANLAMFLAALSAEERDDLNDDLRQKLGFAVSIEAAGGHYSIHVELKDGRYNLVDVGYGYSQILPVAVQLWASRRTLSTSREPALHAVVVIEQPELHLHPHQQALLGRALASFAADEQGPMQIIETHSDHLIGEVGRMIARGRLAPERVGVLCFEPHPEGGTKVSPATFNEHGVLHDWPVGFLSP